MPNNQSPYLLPGTTQLKNKPPASTTKSVVNYTFLDVPLDKYKLWPFTEIAYKDYTIKEKK
jgi:hypothetical protein